MKDNSYSAIRYDKNQGCTIHFWPLLVSILIVVVGLALVTKVFIVMMAWAFS